MIKILNKWYVVTLIVAIAFIALYFRLIKPGQTTTSETIVFEKSASSASYLVLPPRRASKVKFPFKVSSLSFDGEIVSATFINGSDEVIFTPGKNKLWTKVSVTSPDKEKQWFMLLIGQ